MLLEWYVARNVACAAMDMDLEHPYSLAHFSPSVARRDVRTAVGLDPVIDSVDHGSFLVLADLPPGTMGHASVVST
jgi:hypothetical protein